VTGKRKRRRRPQRGCHVVVLAGPNGAGKSTAAPALLKGTLGVTEFVNADTIARGISGFDPQGVAIRAGRVMLARLHDLAANKVSFAFETTLASRHFALWLKTLKSAGYAFHLVFLWLPDADAATLRVETRVRLGGHDVPQETVRRRYDRGLKNLAELYQPIATTWRVYDSSSGAQPALIAVGRGRRVVRVTDAKTWRAVQRSISDAKARR